jgi:hypothetical protein
MTAACCAPTNRGWKTLESAIGGLFQHPYAHIETAEYDDRKHSHYHPADDPLGLVDFLLFVRLNPVREAIKHGNLLT